MFRLIALAIFLGVLHGLMMTPIVYIMDTDQNASTNGEWKKNDFFLFRKFFYYFKILSLNFSRKFRFFFHWHFFF